MLAALAAEANGCIARVPAGGRTESRVKEYRAARSIARQRASSSVGMVGHIKSSYIVATFLLIGRTHCIQAIQMKGG